jgi:hypothetical protein
MTWPTLLLLIGGLVMMLAGITILLRAAGIGDDWDPFR